MCSDNRPLMLWGAIQSYERKLLVKCSNKLNSVGYSEIFKFYDEKKHFLDIIFQQVNVPVHKSKIMGSFFSKTKRVEETEMTSIQSRSEWY